MPRWCEMRKMPDGTVMFITHSGGPRLVKCDYCQNPHSKLCDWPVPGKKSGTCDRKLCYNHSKQPVPEFGKEQDIDYCPEHYELYKSREVIE